MGNKKLFSTNGKAMKASIIFATTDPNITLQLEEMDRQAENEVTVRMEVARLPLAMAEEISSGIKKLF